MAFTQQDLDVIESAIAKGVRRVRLDDREYEYQSITQMLKARDAIRESVLATSNTNGVPRQLRVAQCKGL